MGMKETLTPAIGAPSTVTVPFTRVVPSEFPPPQPCRVRSPVRVAKSSVVFNVDWVIVCKVVVKGKM
jgi:hypothetical protein